MLGIPTDRLSDVAVDEAREWAEAAFDGADRCRQGRAAQLGPVERELRRPQALVVGIVYQSLEVFVVEHAPCREFVQADAGAVLPLQVADRGRENEALVLDPLPSVLQAFVVAVFSRLLHVCRGSGRSWASRAETPIYSSRTLVARFARRAAVRSRINSTPPGNRRASAAARTIPAPSIRRVSVLILEVPSVSPGLSVAPPSTRLLASPLLRSVGQVNPESHFVELDDVSIHLLRWPNVGAPPLLLLHATGFLAALWRGVAEELSAHYDIYAMDARGHGRSGRPQSSYSFQEMAADVAAVLDAHSHRDVYLAGHSMGGGLAVVTAARRPDLVRRIFAVEPILPTPVTRSEASRPSDGRDLATAARKRRPGFASRQDVAERWRDRPPFDVWDSAVFDDYVEAGFEEQPDGTVLLRCPPGIESQVFQSAAGFDAGPFLCDAACPVMLAQGERTDPWFEPMLGHAASLLPHPQRITLPGMGHLAPFENPSLVAREIVAFDS